jgi:hypothetical protein
VTGLPASRLRVLTHLKAALMGIDLAAILGQVFYCVKFWEKGCNGAEDYLLMK